MYTKGNNFPQTSSTVGFKIYAYKMVNLSNAIKYSGT